MTAGPATVPLQAWPPAVRLDELGRAKRIVFFAGLPGVGKSLLVKHLARAAHRAGRQVWLLQWDVVRSPFETPAILERYPEIDGFTHPAIKKAVGVWARRAVWAWHTQHPDAAHVLVVESALVGNRLVELARPAPDDAEALLGGASTACVVPVPSRAVRAAIEAARLRTIAAPRHAREAGDAPPQVLAALWHAVHREAQELGLAAATPPRPPGQLDEPPYDPEAYGQVFLHWLRHRRAEILPVDHLLAVDDSVYALGFDAHDVLATPDEVARAFEAVDSVVADKEAPS